MTTENKSPGYLEEREKVRKWLSSTPEGKYAVDLMIQHDGQSVVANTLNDDDWLSWSDLQREHREDLILASSCETRRAAFELARKSNSLNQPPMSKGSKLLKFFSPQLSYVLRRQIETNDPDYWNDPINVLREALGNPQWCTVPPDYLRGKLADLLGGTKQPVSHNAMPGFEESGPADPVAILER